MVELLECTQRDVEPVRKQIPVLIVEDEVLIRMHLVDILDHEGFTTVEVGSASEAVSMLEGRPDIRVVFTDIEMPGTMNGLALSHYVRHRWPPTIIVVNSGQRRPDLKEMPDGAHFIGKPFQSAELSSVLDGIRRQVG